jgi:hypothetical protein
MFKRIVAVTLVTVCAAIPASAQHDKGSMSKGTMETHKAEAKGQMPHHLGHLAKFEKYEFETVYLPDGIRVYVYQPGVMPIPAREFQGRVVLTRGDDKPESLRFKYIEGDWVGEGNEQTKTHDYLFGPVDLVQADSGSFDAAFYIYEPGEEDTSMEFTQHFPGLTVAPFVCPMCPDGWGATAKSSCGVCGMYTSAKRPGVATKMPEETPHKGGDGHNH